MLRHFLVPVLLMGVAVGSSSAGVVTINDVPSYEWYYGCGPTAAGMIMGYWDAHGFGNLIPGSNSWDTNTQAVKDMIASPGHIRDYYDTYTTPDRVPAVADPFHTDDCVADFMWSSRHSSASGASFENLQSVGMVYYMAYRGYNNASAYYVYYGSAWSELVSSINSSRPAEFYVDSDSDGLADHFVAVVGYDDTPDQLKYAAFNTYDQVMHWYDFVPVQSGKSYGVRSAAFLSVPRLGGDANMDGLVDISDLGILAGHYNSAGTWSQGDFNGDGTVDISDLGILAGNYSASLTTQSLQPLPEPCAIALLVVGAFAVRRKRA